MALSQTTAQFIFERAAWTLVGTRAALNDFCFTADQRVTERAEYLRISREGRRVATPHFVFLLARSAAAGPCRLGITVTKKIGNSVRRSRYKRLIREAFRLTPEFRPNDVAIVIVVKVPNPELKLSDVVAEWSNALPKLRGALKKV